MKKILLALFICAVACNLAYAGAALKKNCGCGLGSILFENNDGLMSQTAAATTNGLFGNQTFGISSGTVECDQPAQFYGSQMLHRFVAENMDNLAKDISRGQGESLETLAVLMDVPQQQRGEFSAKLQSNFGRIFTSPRVTEEEVVANIMTITKTT
jgi:hypothetical protein